MDKATGCLTVFFQEPFWVGVFERTEHGQLTVSKVTFGAEPKDYDVWAFVLKEYSGLKFSPGVTAVEKEKSVNPKRRQREVKRQLSNAGIGTRAQQALQLQREQNKLERKVISREQKEEEARRRFEMKQLKKKDKHKGH